MKASRCACNSINVTQYTPAQTILFLSKATYFDQKLVIFRPLQLFPLADALPTLGSHWDPKVGKASLNENIVRARR